MSQVILDKLDAIEAKQAESIVAVEAKIPAAVEAVKAEMSEMVAALEAKVASIQAPEFIRAPAKTVRQDVNRKVVEQLKTLASGSKTTFESKLQVFADEAQYDAYMKEASALTAGGDGKGGRTAYDPVFVALRLANPLRGVSRTVATDGSSYQFRVKTGNAGARWGYGIQNNGAETTENTKIWQQVLKDINVQFPIRTAALDDIDGLEANVVDDMLAEFAESEGLGMIKNFEADGDGTTNPYGGSDGVRGINSYPGANASYAGGVVSVSSFGPTGTGASSGLHNLATYDQLTTNGDGQVNEVVYKDMINFIYSLPQQYWTPNAKFMINPLMLAAIRGLTDQNGTPIFKQMEAMTLDGIVGQMLGFDVVVNKYMDNPFGTGVAGDTSLYPILFADFPRYHTIVDRLNMVLRRYDQTLPGYITFYGEKRLQSGIRDPFSGVRYRSTATATV